MDGHQHDTGRRGETMHGGDRPNDDGIKKLGIFFFLFSFYCYQPKFFDDDDVGDHDHHSTPNYRHEPLLVGWKRGASGTGRGPRGPRPRESSQHPLPPPRATARRVHMGCVMTTGRPRQRQRAGRQRQDEDTTMKTQTCSAGFHTRVTRR
jgi:hypothetical protein